MCSFARPASGTSPYLAKEKYQGRTSCRVRGGGPALATWLCRWCNSRFGTHQDKWLGEYLRLSKQENSSFLHAKHQAGFFEIGGTGSLADIT